jgi:hypothetical protein
MAILSKMLSGLAHLVTKKTIYVVGAVIIAVAKPACEYTIKIIKSSVIEIEDTIVQKNKFIMRELVNEIIVMNKIMLTDFSAMQSDTVKELINNNANRMNESIETNINKIITMFQTVNVDDIETKEKILATLNDINDKLSEKSENVHTQAELRDYIETIAKKYAMYLHDEHMELMNVKNQHNPNSGDLTTNANEFKVEGKQEQTSNLSHLKIPTPRNSKNNDIATVPKLTMRKPLSARN